MKIADTNQLKIVKKSQEKRNCRNKLIKKDLKN